MVTEAKSAGQIEVPWAQGTQYQFMMQYQLLTVAMNLKVMPLVKIMRDGGEKDQRSVCLRLIEILLQYMTEARWNWRMMKVIFTELHFYDAEKNYRPFDFLKEERFLALQRKVLPDFFKA